MNQQSQNSQPVERLHFQADRDDELSLIEIFKVLAKYKYLIIIFTLLSTSGAYYYTQTLPTVYKTEALMIPASGSGSGGNVSLSNRLGSISDMVGFSLGGGGSSAGAEGDQALARLKTRSFLMNHIIEKNLKPVLYEDQWIKTEKQWVDKEPSDREASEFLQGMMDISMDPRDIVGLVTLSLEWKNPINPNSIADIANNLVSSMNIHAKRRAIEQAKNSILFLEKELERTSILNSQIILYNLIEQQTAKVMMANVRDEFVFKVIDPAVIPSRAETKPVLIIIFIGAALGIFFGSFIAISINYFKEQSQQNLVFNQK